MHIYLFLAYNKFTQYSFIFITNLKIVLRYANNVSGDVYWSFMDKIMI